MSQTVMQVPKIILKCHIYWNNLLHSFEISTSDHLKIISRNKENEFGYYTETYGYECIDYFPVLSLKEHYFISVLMRQYVEAFIIFR